MVGQGEIERKVRPLIGRHTSGDLCGRCREGEESSETSLLTLVSVRMCTPYRIPIQMLISEMKLATERKTNSQNAPSSDQVEVEASCCFHGHCLAVTSSPLELAARYSDPL